MSLTRREFLAAAAAAAAAPAAAESVDDGHAAPLHAEHAGHSHPKPARPTVPRLPAVLCKLTGTAGIDAAYDLLLHGHDTLEAALLVTRTQEDDADDHTNGLGGLPGENGEVQLDACCWHGPTRRGAAIGAVSGVRNASLLARDVMENSGDSLLVGSDAQRFALARGFVRENLLTERTRKMYAVWQQVRSTAEPLGPVLHDPHWPGAAGTDHFLSASQRDLDVLVHKMETYAAQAGLGPQWTWRAAYDALFPAADALYVAAINGKQEISSAATTSGLPWRRAGVVGDIAVLGSGCYLDPEVGSAGCSGNAAANIKVAGAHAIVENMRAGMAPGEAGLDALRRIVSWYEHDMTALRFVEVVYYVLRKDGAYGCVSLWRGDRTGHVRQFTIHDGVRRSEDCGYLFDGNPPNGTPAAA